MTEKDISLEQLKKIGTHLRKLRKENFRCGYIEFATKAEMDKKTYYNLERGEKDYTLGSLFKVLAIYSDLSLSKFFKDAGL